MLRTALCSYLKATAEELVTNIKIADIKKFEFVSKLLKMLLHFSDGAKRTLNCLYKAALTGILSRHFPHLCNHCDSEDLRW
jgi:hypothetical protein